MTATTTPKAAKHTPTPDAHAGLKKLALAEAGNPKNVLKVDVRPIGAHTARVNVWVRTPGGEAGVIEGAVIGFSKVYAI